MVDKYRFEHIFEILSRCYFNKYDAPFYKETDEKGATCCIKAEIDGRPWFEIREKKGTLMLVAFDGMHLCDIISLIGKTGITLEGGQSPLPYKCVDFYDRVWFMAENKKPNAGDEVLVEIEQGEMLWCTWDGEKFISSGSPVTEKGLEVDAYKWAWTYE